VKGATLAPLRDESDSGSEEDSGLFSISDDDSDDDVYERVRQRRIAVASGSFEAEDKELSDALKGAEMSEKLELRIAELANGDEKAERDILIATAKMKGREKRDYELAGEARRKALGIVFRKELARLALPDVTDNLSTQSIPKESSESTKEILSNNSSLRDVSAQRNSFSLLLHTAYAITTSMEGNFGAGMESELLKSCENFGMDIRALQRLAYAKSLRAQERHSRRRPKNMMEQYDSDDESEQDEFSSEGDHDSEDVEDASPLRRGHDFFDDEWKGIAMPSFPPSVGKAFRVGGKIITDIPDDAPGDLNPTASGLMDVSGAIEIISKEREAMGEMRARSELYITVRLVLQVLAATAFERQQFISGNVKAETKMTRDEFSLGFKSSDHPTDKLLNAALIIMNPMGKVKSVGEHAELEELLKRLRVGALTIRNGSSEGGVPFRDEEGFVNDKRFPDKVAVVSPPPVFTASQYAGSPVNRLPLGGPGGIQALAGLSQGGAIGTIPSIIPITSEEANELAVELGYPPRDPVSGLALIPDKEAMLAASEYKKSLRRGGNAVAVERASAKSNHSALEASLSKDEGTMVDSLMESVEAEDKKRGGPLSSDIPRKPSLLPPGFRNWNEVVASSVGSPREKSVAAALASSQQAKLDSPIRAASDRSGQTPTPRAIRMASNITSSLTQLIAEGAVGPLALSEPKLYPCGLPVEVKEVSVTADFRTAFVRWSLPALAGVEERLATSDARSGVTGRPTPSVHAPLHEKFAAGMHLTSPTARALFMASSSARGARAAQVERAKRKPRPADAYKGFAALGGGVSTVISSIPQSAFLPSMVKGVEEALQRSAWGLRRAIADRLKLRFVPRLHFFLWEGKKRETNKLQ